MTFEERRAQLRAIVDSWTEDERQRARAAMDAEQERIRGEQSAHGIVHAFWQLLGR